MEQGRSMSSSHSYEMLPISISPTANSAPKSRGIFQRRWLIAAVVVVTLGLLWLLGSYHYSPKKIDSRPTSPPPLLQSGKQAPASSESHPEAVTWERRKGEVRDAYVHALSGYMKHAFPNDELLSISGGKSNKFNGWSVTLLDSMDTMWTMGLYKEFYDAVDVVAQQKFKIASGYAHFFETVIRYLGGLLSAYALSKEPILLTRADDLGRMLLPVFNATPSGLPAHSINPQTGEIGQGWMGNSILFAEAATCQLEYKYLAKLTGRTEYYERAEKVMKLYYDLNPPDGLFAVSWSPDGKPRDTHYSVGGASDSGYEYMLKQWLLSGDTKARDQYLKSVDGILKNLAYVSPKRELLYVTDTSGGNPTHNFEHLACFLPGILALGAYTLDLPPRVKELHQWAAEGLAYTCWLAYVDQKSGLSPDGIKMVPGTKWLDRLRTWEAGGKVGGVPPGLKEEGKKPNGEWDYSIGSSVYLLRPETVESIYVLWKTTGDVKWRHRGYEIFTAIERAAKTKYGYSSVRNVDLVTPHKIDDMPSYFLAETLKYLYLLFDDTDHYPFNKWVFNTEAHPLPAFTWSDWEKKAYGLL